MRFIHDTKIDFIGVRKIGYIVTAICILLSFTSMGYHHATYKELFHWGIDFSGGIMVETRFSQPVNEDQIRTALNGLNIEELTIQRIGLGNESNLDFRIRTRSGSRTVAANTDISKQIVDIMSQKFAGNKITVLSQSAVGASVAGDFIKNAMWAILFSWLCIIGWIFYRYEFKFAIAGVFALVHDTIITLGALSLLNKEITLVVVAAILTNIGYSIHDTIIIYDRIRENRKIQRKMDFAELVNLSTNQTLSRTILTVLTVLMVEITLFIFGGQVLHDFVFTLIVGLITGSFSSIYVASPIILEWINWEKRRGIKRTA